ncbi:MAG TPA: sugar phosphate isomerase/epimerase [Candidatus Limnocylindria bacterium]|nr:sugar phosphate isomerase/epimerase [Candidatus Limnocylindria bacterium]
MRVGVFDPIFGDLPLDETLERVVELGLEAVELGTGNAPGDRRCRPAELLHEPAALERLHQAVESRGLIISALSCQGNPVHPDEARAAAQDRVFRDTVRLAERLGVRAVNVFAGCPGDGRGSRTPVWQVYTWPEEHAEVLRWQWEEVVIPYWREAASFALDHGVALAFEMHPNFVVYNPPTWRRLHEAVGDAVRINLDPSHLFWQGVDVIDFIGEYGAHIVHVDCKDTYVDEVRVRREGLLDITTASGPGDRSWLFRSVGDGHDLVFWTRFVGALRDVGYDHVLSIEHEDPLASPEDGLRRAAGVLREALSGAASR